MKKYSIIGILAVFMLIAGVYALNDNMVDVGEITVPYEEQYIQGNFGLIHQDNTQEAVSEKLKSTHAENIYVLYLRNNIGNGYDTFKLDNPTIIDVGEITVQSKEQYIREKFGKVDQLDNELSDNQELTTYEELKSAPPENVHYILNLNELGYAIG